MAGEQKASDAVKETVVIETGPGAESDRELVKYANELFTKSSGMLDDMAKNLIALVTTVTALFVSIVSILHLSFNYAIWPKYWPLAVAFVCWLISIYLNLTVYSPRLHRVEMNNPDAIGNTIEEINNYKYKRLKWSTLFFLFGLGLLVLAIASALVLQPAHDKVHFTMTDNGVMALRNMSIQIDPATATTGDLYLIEQSDKMYTVEKPDGSKAEFAKDLVRGIIYLK